MHAVPLVDADVAWTLSAVVSAGRPRSRALYAFLDLMPHHIRGDRVF
ncbi:hypothetical protein [Streptomonospora sediminis]